MTFAGALPAFEVRPEHFFHKIGGMLGMQDINLPNRPVFSSKFLLRSPDEAAVRELFGDAICDLLEKHLKLSVEAADHYMIVYQASRRPKPEQLAAFLDTARAIRDALLHHAA
jgi:hypothetical protein